VGMAFSDNIGRLRFFCGSERARSRWKEGIARQLYIEVRGTIGLDKHANTVALVV